jgi:hypothetical protein
MRHDVYTFVMHSLAEDNASIEHFIEQAQSTTHSCLETRGRDYQFIKRRYEAARPAAMPAFFTSSVTARLPSSHLGYLES